MKGTDLRVGNWTQAGYISNYVCMFFYAFYVKRGAVLLIYYTLVAVKNISAQKIHSSVRGAWGWMDHQYPSFQDKRFQISRILKIISLRFRLKKKNCIMNITYEYTVGPTVDTDTDIVATDPHFLDRCHGGLLHLFTAPVRICMLGIYSLSALFRVWALSAHLHWMFFSGQACQIVSADWHIMPV